MFAPWIPEALAKIANLENAPEPPMSSTITETGTEHGIEAIFEQIDTAR
jgi:hypothetical protein